ncbi:MAG: hypothetical protein RLZ12_808 [Bacillota bacterium]
MAAYNKLNKYNQGVLEKFSIMEVQYQRRVDLLPNILAVAERYAGREHNVIKDVADARAKLAGGQQLTVDQKLEQQQRLDSIFSRLLMIKERYPDLRSNKHFASLMAEWSGTENRISYARREYAEAVKSYNVYTGSFFGHIWAKLFGFDQEKSYYKANATSAQPPSARELFRD